MVVFGDLGVTTDVGELLELGPPSQLSIALLEAHDTSITLVLTRHVEHLFVKRVIVEELRHLRAVEIIGGFSESLLVEFKTPVDEGRVEVGQTKELDLFVHDEGGVEVLLSIVGVSLVVVDTAKGLVHGHNIIASIFVLEGNVLVDGTVFGVHVHDNGLAVTLAKHGQ